MLRVGLVLDDTLDSPDGVQQYVLSVGDWLAQAGHEVHYLVGHTERTDLNNLHSLSRNVAVKYNGNRLSVPLPASKRKLRRLLKELNLDVLHVQVPYSPFLAGRLITAAAPDMAVVGTFHILPYNWRVRFGNRLLSLVNRRTGRRFDRMLAVSPPARDFAASVFHYDPVVVPNPIQVARFSSAVVSSPTIKIVFLGRLVERKGAGLLLRALAKLYKEGSLPPDVRIVIGGKGPLLDDLQAFTDSHGLAEVVQFAGFVFEEDKAAFLAQADIAVFPSVSGESFGIILLEAMAAARGVVLAGNNPGYASVMGDRPHQLFAPHDIQSFAALLKWWLDHPDERAKAAAWQQSYVTGFDVGVVGKQLEAIYKEALQSRTRA